MDKEYSDYENGCPEITEDEISEDELSPEAEGAVPSDTGRVEIVGIKFRRNGKTYYFAPGGFELHDDDRVIVDTARGQEYGYTAVTNREVNASEIVSPLRSVLRMATEEDTIIHEENLKKEIEAYNNCIALIDQHKLQMKLIDVEFAFDRSKLLFYFSAEGRVDFRDLVRDLASVFHTRIEMRQIGIRDEAKILGGLGICGRPFCCSSFLSDFVQVSVKMAKEQNLSLNSAKISGACGRLMCCLRYEYDTYLKERAITPKVGGRVMSPDGPGVVTEANPLTGIVKVKLDLLPEDAEHSVFLRDDLVNEDEYTGEKLTRTEIPDRQHKNDAEKTIFGMTESTLIALNEQTPEPVIAVFESDEGISEPSLSKTERNDGKSAKADNEERRAHRPNGRKGENREKKTVPVAKPDKREQPVNEDDRGSVQAQGYNNKNEPGEEKKTVHPGKGGQHVQHTQHAQHAQHRPQVKQHVRRDRDRRGSKRDEKLRDSDGLGDTRSSAQENTGNSDRKKPRRPFNRNFRKNRRVSDGGNGGADQQK